MMEEPNLIRRPLVLANGKAVFGYDSEEYERLAKK
jgi:arsenate reductase-like glutaredoxin family protein